MTKIAKLLLSLSTSLIVSSSVFANLNGSADVCDNLAGNWSGKGDVRLFVFSCKYDAKVKVGEGNPAVVDVTVNKTGGSFFCPKTVQHTVTGTCNSSDLTMKDEKIDVAGKLSEDGRSANLSGTIRVLMKAHSFNLTMQKDS